MIYSSAPRAPYRDSAASSRTHLPACLPALNALGHLTLVLGLAIAAGDPAVSRDHVRPAAAAQAATEAAPTPTAVPAATAAPTTAPAAAAPAQVDLTAVAAAVTKGGCAACHVMPGVPNAVGVVGPDMSNIGNEASTRVPGQSAEEYLHESIVNPNAHTAPDCPFGPCVAGAMPANMTQLLTPEEIDLLVDYLLTQTGG